MFLSAGNLEMASDPVHRNAYITPERRRDVRRSAGTNAWPANSSGGTGQRRRDRLRIDRTGWVERISARISIAEEKNGYRE